MIKIIDGDLFVSKTDMIAHQVNCQGAFRSGVAKAIREYDKKVYEDYHSYCVEHTTEELLGTVRYYRSDMNGRYYANLFAQDKYGYNGKQYTDVKMLRKCLEDLKLYAQTNGGLSIAMPYKIGCVRGGANWDEVYTILEEIFQDYDVELWRLDQG